MENTVLESSNKKVGRPKIYSSKDEQILESRRHLKLKRCENDILKKYSKYVKLSKDENEIKNLISRLQKELFNQSQ